MGRLQSVTANANRDNASGCIAIDGSYNVLFVCYSNILVSMLVLRCLMRKCSPCLCMKLSELCLARPINCRLPNKAHCTSRKGV